MQHEEKSMIEELERARYRAVLHGDHEAFERLCHTELIYGHSGGNRDSRAEYTEKLRTGALSYHAISHSIERITIVGEAALVFGQMSSDLTVNGLSKSMECSFLSIWLQEFGSWKFAAYQPTPLVGAGPFP
ncbi:hypothetical protein ABIE37_000146 [Arthrobacter bambusae]|uniref:DUF4440 domain-containing protein n=1 Tax=Arthrobacter bambusae TaxID=1338426 RepID=A0ABV2P1C3_9MICC